MRNLIALCLLAFVAGASAQCACNTMKWALCDGSPCACTVPVGTGVKQVLDCITLVPKCYLMQAEMYRARNNLSTRSTIGGKPVETAFVDNDGIYDPVCENNGRFKAVQCNGTETCWCVNSAGVRRSDKGDKNIKCEPVETYWVRLQLTHMPINKSVTEDHLKTAIENVVLQRYFLDKKYVKSVQYDSDASLIVVDLQKDKGKDPNVDLPRVAYYMEKDIKVLPLFKNPTAFQLNTADTNVLMKNILVYYVDEVPPTFTMKTLTGGVIAVIVVVVLAVVIGLLVLFFLRRREQAQYNKSQAREMEPMS